MKRVIEITMDTDIESVMEDVVEYLLATKYYTLENTPYPAKTGYLILEVSDNG